VGGADGIVGPALSVCLPYTTDTLPKAKVLGRARGLLILLFVLLLAFLLDVKLGLLPLFLITFVFLSNVTHDKYSFLVGLSVTMTGSRFMYSVIR
jgi:hypothetical protein